ncbi:MAG: hypothetical protein E7F96_08530 [Veillonella sp.]|uniref:hypothetical protein n=1 Tax=Veillonella sp. TaxID=1926307 RepID=UPI00290BB7DE|nr:hypothetical protein [Veillonella sp.]MDU3602326.1 hypothetical protein [Veillonella sp.]
MYRVWYSTENFADYIIHHTRLNTIPDIKKLKLYESDANNPKNFHKMPDHIRKILYLDAPDLIIEKDGDPIFSIEVSTEAGTGHNAFQRFARIAASIENDVPCIYIYPEGALISRQGQGIRWDKINPSIFQALKSIRNIYKIPALLFYYPTVINQEDIISSEYIRSKGLLYDDNYLSCPKSDDSEMISMFNIINKIIDMTETYGIHRARERLLADRLIQDRIDWMDYEYYSKASDRTYNEMSPMTSTLKIPTRYLIKHLEQYFSGNYILGDLIKSREETIIYKINAKFRGDPYPGALAAIDYLACRENKTYEDRKYNLVLLFGDISINNNLEKIDVLDNGKSTISDFINDVKNAKRLNLLDKSYTELSCEEIPRYLMQVRYGSTYSKVKHIRVYSYFADAIVFPDGALWRDG